MQDTVTTLLNLVLPKNCNCEKMLPQVYRITCADFSTARGVWEHRFESLYPLLKKGDVLEVVGEEFYVKSHPKP